MKVVFHSFERCNHWVHFVWNGVPDTKSSSEDNLLDELYSNDVPHPPLPFYVRVNLTRKHTKESRLKYRFP